MTQFHAQLLFNATTYVGSECVPKETPHPGLKTKINRTFLGSWHEIEKQQGVYDWTLIDAVMKFNTKQGLKVIVCMTAFPAWANERKDRWTLFRDFLALFKARYIGYDYIVEGHNEFDNAESPWQYDPVGIAQFWLNLREAFTDKLVIFGSVQSLGATGMGLQHMHAAYDEYLKTGGAPPEAISVHCYEIPGFRTIEEFTPRLAEVRGWMIGVGLAHAQLWVTEYGRYTIGNKIGAKMHVDLTGAQKRQWHRRAKRAIIAAKTVDHAIYWELDNGDRLHGGFGWDDMTAARIDWNATEDVHFDVPIKEFT